MKIEPLERISDPVNNPLGTADKINRNTARIERAFRNALFRDGAPKNYMEADIQMNRNKITLVRVHEYDQAGSPVTTRSNPRS